MAEITAEDIGLPVDPEVDQGKLRKSIATASDKPIKPTVFNLGETRSPREILQAEQQAKGVASSTGIKPASFATIANDPKFKSLPQAEQAKVIEAVLSKDAGFQGLPKEEQEKVRARLLPSQPKGFIATLTEGGPEGLLKETLPVLLADRMKDMREANAKFQQGDEWNKERQRRIKAGESLNGMEQWKLNRLNDLIKSTKPDQPVHSPGEIWEGVKKAAVDNPAGFAGSIARGLITSPELFFLPESLPARAAGVVQKLGRVAENVARTGADVAQVAGAVGAESTLKQLVERGQTQPAQTAMDMVMTAVPIAGVRALVPHTKAQVGMAADLALAKDAKTKGIEPSAELTRRVTQETEAAVSKGQPLDKALNDALNAVGVSEEAAKEAAAMVKPEGETHAADQERPQGDVRDDQGVRSQEGETSVLRERQQGQDQGRPQEEKVTLKPIEETRIGQRLKAVKESQDRYDVLEEAKAKRFKESGKIDPALLKSLGLAGAVGLGVGAYTNDPQKAIIAALATGGVLGAGALLMRGARATGKAMRDERFRIGDLTNKFQGDVDWGKFQNQKFKEAIKGMVGDKKQREQITLYMQGDESIKLTPEQQEVVKSVREFFRVNGDKGMKAGAIEGLIDDYVTQLWTGLDKSKSLVRNLIASLGKGNTSSASMSPRSRFGMERVIPSYKEGMAKGLIPATLDIADIVEIYGNSINRAIANKNFIAALKNERMPDGRLIMGSMKDVTKDITKNLELTKDQWQGHDALADDIRRFAESKTRNDYVLMTHRQLPGMMVHKDVAPVLKWFFDNNDPNAATKLAYAVAVAAKRGIFSYSLFHVKSLTEAALGTPMKGWLNVVNGKAWELLKGRGNQDVMENLVRGGLKVVEAPLEGDVTPFTHMLQLIAEKHPIVGAPAKGLDIVQRAMNGFLWGVVMPTYKTAVAMAAYEKVLKNSTNPAFLTRVADKVLGRRETNLSKQDAGKIAASFGNDIFGGLDWFRIADGVQNKLGRTLALAVTAPAGRRFMQIMALAPDWTVATARAMAKAIPGVSRREIAALHQGYVVRSMLLVATMNDALNLYFSGHHFWENDDPTMIDLGDGRKMQSAKHFMEPIHWLLSTRQQALNKLGYIPKEIAEQLLNKKYLSAKGSAPPISTDSMSTFEGAMARTKHALGGVMPIGAQMWYDEGFIPSLSGFFGFPIYGKTDEQYVEAAKKSAEEKQKEWSQKSDKEKKGHREPASPSDAARRAQDRRDRARRKAEEARAP